MLHHERFKPPSRDYPADEWNIVEKRFHPEFLAHAETMLALGNGYLGIRGGPEAAVCICATLACTPRRA